MSFLAVSRLFSSKFYLDSSKICVNVWQHVLLNPKDLRSTVAPYHNFPSKNRLNLTPQQNVLLQCRNIGFFSKISAEKLWKGVTSVSNAGRKRGRGKGSRKVMAKNLNRGQIIGRGEQNMLWPGLNAPVVRGGEIIKQQSLPKDEERIRKIYEIRDKMGVFRPLRLNPLERGWSGTKLPGRRVGPPEAIGEDHFHGFDSIVLETKTVTKMTGNLGRKRRISLFLVTGNSNGLAGFGLAKANTIPNATRQAKTSAGQRLMYIERCDGHTVFHDFFCQFMSTRIFVKQKPEGYGLVCHRAIKEICKMVGIRNIHAKIEGSTNVQNITKAVFLGLLSQKTHQQMADEKSLYVVKLRPNSFPEVKAKPSDGAEVRSRDQVPMDEETDFKLYTMDGKVEIERKKFEPFYVRLPSYETHLKKVLKNRNHEKIKKQLLLEYGDVRSFFTDKYPECHPKYVDKEED